MTTHYPIEEVTEKKIERTFSYHPPSGDQRLRYDVLRDRFKALAFTLVGITPVSREQSLALTKLEEALFFANAAIARYEKNEAASPNPFESSTSKP
jgi:hypothetical protein